jgi:putative lipase involved disintegration of autophagic bodies
MRTQLPPNQTGTHWMAGIKYVHLLHVVLHLVDESQSTPFGWEPDADGFRGHVFVSDDNSTVVLSIKGTSAGWITGGGGPSTRKDKLNDNLLFSCCCARVGPTWSTVCDCYRRNYRCDQTCVERSLIEESLFYSVGVVCPSSKIQSEFSNVI